MIASIALSLIQFLAPAPAAFAPAVAQAATATSSITGIVHDASGGVVVGAVVIARGASGATTQGVTSADGAFSLTAPSSGPIVIVVQANGFADSRVTVTPGSTTPRMDIVLAPATVAQSVTVTATRAETRVRDVPASVTVVQREDIQQSPAVVADDVLRDVPSFSLFRRTSSLAANPTAQGVSLRGIGPSGVSRTLVLLDGVPFNDPFGGWVYWSRVPLQNTQRIEVVDGTTSNLYGNYAMGGVINIVTTPPAARTLDVSAQYGNLSSPMGNFSASDVWGKFAVSVDGNAYKTDGYPIVAASERGAVDNNADDAFHNVNLKFTYDPTSRVHAFFGTGYFRENRNNGKMSTVDGTEEANDTRWTSTNGGVRIHLPDKSELDATVFTDSELFHASFLAVPTATPARSIGRMSLNQTVPSDGVGGMVQWSRALGGNQVFTAGTDWRWVKGDSEENGLDATTGTSVILNRVSGGRQQISGAFVQDVLTPTKRLTLTVSARVDHWRNYDAHNLEHNYPSGTPTANNQPNLPDRTDTVGSPHAAALYRLTSRVNVWGDYGYGFRAPTLNELYRQFRMGTTLTLPNDELGPERLKGGEAGVTIEPTSRSIVRATWFDNRIKDPVSNVTTSVVAGTTTVTRENLGATRVWGVQVDAEYRFFTFWKVSGGYLYDHATVTADDAVPALVGNFLPQVPKHRGSVQVTYSNPRFATIALDVQATGSQFDDDQNLRIVPNYTTPGLPKYAVVGFRVSRALGNNFELFLGAQNLFNQIYYVGTLPTTVGSPRVVTGGMRMHLGAR